MAGKGLQEQPASPGPPDAGIEYLAQRFGAMQESGPASRRIAVVRTNYTHGDEILPSTVAVGDMLSQSVSSTGAAFAARYRDRLQAETACT
jgi:hypothetical protein